MDIDILKKSIVDMMKSVYQQGFSDGRENSSAFEDGFESDVQMKLNELFEERVIVLPYKLEDTVYAIEQGYCDDEDCPDEYHDYVNDVYIDQITYNAWDSGDVEIKFNGYLNADDTYKTRAEAEAALMEQNRGACPCDTCVLIDSCFNENTDNRHECEVYRIWQKGGDDA